MAVDALCIDLASCHHFIGHSPVSKTLSGTTENTDQININNVNHSTFCGSFAEVVMFHEGRHRLGILGVTSMR